MRTKRDTTDLFLFPQVARGFLTRNLMSSSRQSSHLCIPITARRESPRFQPAGLGIINYMCTIRERDRVDSN